MSILKRPADEWTDEEYNIVIVLCGGDNLEQIVIMRYPEPRSLSLSLHMLHVLLTLGGCGHAESLVCPAHDGVLVCTCWPEQVVEQLAFPRQPLAALCVARRGRGVQSGQP